MNTLITVIHVITCVLIVLVVLLQSGKGAEISASLSGSSQSVFGASGGINFFQKLTFGLAILFMATSVFLTWSGSKSKTSVFDSGIPTTTQSAPAQSTSPATTSSAPDTKAPAAPDTKTHK